MPRWLRFSFGFLLTAAVILLFFAAAGGASSELFDRWFPILLVCNLFAVITLFIFITAVVIRLVKRWKERAFGSRMTGKLVLAISLIALLPCLLIYLVSSQFIGRSIDSWFDVRVEHALDSGVSLSGEILAREQNRLQTSAVRTARSLAGVRWKDLATQLEKLRDVSDFSRADIFRNNGALIAQTEKNPGELPLIAPTTDQLATALEEQSLTLLEDESEQNAPLQVRAIVPIGVFVTDTGRDRLFLQLTQATPAALSANIADLLAGYRDYQELVLTRGALRNIYGVTLTLTLLLVVLAAIAAALRFAGTMTAPVLQLAKGTRKVAEGDLRPIREYQGNDEINTLTQSFNTMVAELAESRTLVENQRAQAERARASLERILSTISSGVLVTDDRLFVYSANTAAATVLKNDTLNTGVVLSDVEPEFSAVLSEQIQITDDDNFHTELTLQRRANDAPLALFVRGSRIKLETGRGWVIVFDDMSSVLDAQRALAWGEVARRLAHEIKNPLTPIRLAAERLNMKLADKLDEKDHQLLTKACGTIVNQVDAMKQMVNDFRDYAKLPTAVLRPLNVNELFTELTDFYRTAGTPVEFAPQAALPLIRGDEAQLRQIVHNLVGNAIDATAGLTHADIRLSAAAVRNSAGDAKAVRITIEDNGPGFSENILNKAFEPYVTTKPTGTGLGLPMVKKIIEEHHAKISLDNKTDGEGRITGALITMIFPVLLSENPAETAA